MKYYPLFILACFVGSLMFFISAARHRTTKKQEPKPEPPKRETAYRD